MCFLFEACLVTVAVNIKGDESGSLDRILISLKYILDSYDCGSLAAQLLSQNHTAISNEMRTCGVSSQIESFQTLVRAQQTAFEVLSNIAAADYEDEEEEEDYDEAGNDDDFDEAEDSEEKLMNENHGEVI